MGLGAVHSVSLSEARTKAREARGLLANDKDPIEERTAKRLEARLVAARQLTFRQCAERYIASHRTGWRNEKHAAQWGSSLDAYAYPLIGELAVAEVDLHLVRRILEPIWSTKTETASRVRGRIEAILDWATVNGIRNGDNPARWRGNLSKILPERSRVAKIRHHVAMSYQALPSFMSELRENDSVSAKALRFTILTASRTSETVGAKWSEFELDTGLWTIPGSRMKAKRDHRVPLSDHALDILSSLPRGAEFAFVGARGNRPLSNMAMLELLRGLDKTGATVHGFRSTFMDWGHDVMGFSKEMMDLALAHRVSDKVEAAYRRSDMLQRRRTLMTAWASFCEGHADSKIVPIRTVA